MRDAISSPTISVLESIGVVGDHHEVGLTTAGVAPMQRETARRHLQRCLVDAFDVWIADDVERAGERDDVGPEVVDKTGRRATVHAVVVVRVGVVTPLDAIPVALVDTSRVGAQHRPHLVA